MSLPEELFVAIRGDVDEEYLLAEDDVDDLALGLNAGESEVIGIYKLFSKRTLAVVAHVAPVE